MTRHLRLRSALPAAQSLLLLLATGPSPGCGKDEAAAPTAPAGASVVVSPSDPVVLFGDTLQFQATVTGVSGGVLWRLAPGNPSTVDIGTITAGGLYAAPVSGSGPVDFQVLVTAKSDVDTTIFDTAVARIPRIQVVVQPAILTSVPPGTDVPYSVEVRYALDPGFELLVDGVLGGDASVGIFEQTGPTAAVYHALDALPALTLYSLLVRSAQSPTQASATPFLSVRRGYPLEGDPAKQQMSPEWDASGSTVAYAEGPPWNLVTQVPETQARSVITTIDDPGALYDGRISWSPDGEWLVFSETAGGRPVVGFVRANGDDRGVFDPDGVSDVLDAAFLPTAFADPESLLVVLRSGSTHRLRAYPLALTPGEQGVAILEPPAGVVLRHPDGVRFDGVLHVTLARTTSGENQVLGFAVDGAPLDLIEIDPGVSGPASRPVWTPQGLRRRITYISEANATAHRVTWGEGNQPIRLYAEFHPEQAFDRVESRPDDVVMSRLHPDGFHRVWLVQFPAHDYIPKPTEDEALRAAGAWRAWTPSEWARWKSGGFGTGQHEPRSYPSR